MAEQTNGQYFYGDGNELGKIIKTNPTMPDTDGDGLTDLELFLTQQNDGYKAPLQDITYDKETGIISNDDYMKYAEYNRDNIYYLGEIM